jgi:hypothetical protein
VTLRGSLSARSAIPDSDVTHVAKTALTERPLCPPPPLAFLFNIITIKFEISNFIMSSVCLSCKGTIVRSCPKENAKNRL